MKPSQKTKIKSKPFKTKRIMINFSKISKELRKEIIKRLGKIGFEEKGIMGRTGIEQCIWAIVLSKTRKGYLGDKEVIFAQHFFDREKSAKTAEQIIDKIIIPSFEDMAKNSWRLKEMKQDFWKRVKFLFFTN